MVPRVEDDFTDSFPSGTDLLARAMRQNALTYPAWGEFVKARNELHGDVEAIVRTQAAIARVCTVTPKACERPAHFRDWHQWPPDHLVNGLANTLGGTAKRQRETLEDHARWLAGRLTRLLEWSRGQKAQGVEPTLTALPEATDLEPSPTVTEFNVFARPR